MTIQRIDCGPRMSQAVVHNGIAYLAGQVGAPGEDATAQTTAILAAIDDLLARAGTDKTKLLTAQVWVADIDRDFAPMNAVWDAWVPADNAPARRLSGRGRLVLSSFSMTSVAWLFVARRPSTQTPYSIVKLLVPIFMVRPVRM